MKLLLDNFNPSYLKRLSFLLALVVLLFAGEIAKAQFPYAESFKNTSAADIILGGSSPAELTANTIDDSGSGYLRLTSNNHNQVGFARSTKLFPSAGGYSISFEYYSHSSVQGADGLVFFLYDPSGSFNYGASGGSLGYAQGTGIPGLSNGYLAIGLDEYGGFSNANEGRSGGIGNFESSVVLRGDGNGMSNAPDNYEYLTGIQTIDASAMSSIGAGNAFRLEGGVDGRMKLAGLTEFDLGYRKAEIEMRPNGTGTGFKVNVWIVEGSTDGGIRHHLIKDYMYAGSSLPSDLSFGFTASTGTFAYVHEVRNLNIDLPADPNTASLSLVSKSGYENSSVNFLQADFASRFSTLNNTPLAKIRIETLPSNGYLEFNNAVVSLGQEIDLAEIDDLFFVPASGFSGADSFNWNGSNGILYSQNSSRVNLNIAPLPTALPYSETFRNSAAPGVVLGAGSSAVLTSGGIDGIGNGYLRLTSNTPNQIGYVYSTKSFPSSNGYSISFDYYSYGSTANEADGIVFFLYDQTGPFNIGGLGGSLGYSQTTTSAGVSNAFIGIGLDEYGNFSLPADGRQGGIGNRSSSVVVRGPGNGNASIPGNYDYLGGVKTTDLVTAPFKITGGVEGRNIATDGLNASQEGYRKAEIDLKPDGTGNGFIINVWITEGQSETGKLHHVIKDLLYQGNIPTNLSYGFSSTTGTFSNVHEIRNLKIGAQQNLHEIPGNPADVYKVTAKNTQIGFTVGDFYNADPSISKFKDPSGRGLSRIRISSIPAKGILKLGASNVSVNQEIKTTDLMNLNYTPSADFKGMDAFGWIGANDDTEGFYSLAGASVNIFVSEGSNTYTANVNESDVYSFPTYTAPGISYSIAGSDAGQFNFNANSGTLTMSPQSYKTPKDANGDNVYEFAIKGSNNYGDIDVYQWKVNIVKLPEPSAFTIDAIADTTLRENIAYAGPVISIKGYFQGQLEYTLGGADATDFTINSTTGLVSMYPRSFDDPVDSNTDNVYEISVIAKDATGTTYEMPWKITVVKNTVNALKSLLLPETGAISANGKSIQTLTVVTKDSDGKNISVKGLSVEIVKLSGKGVVSGVTDHGNGKYTAVVTSSVDGGEGVFAATINGKTVNSGTSKQTQSRIKYIGSSYAGLSGLGLSVGEISPAFDTNTFSYSTTVDNEVSSIILKPGINNNTTVKVNGTEITSDDLSKAVELTVGNNNITIEVTAADGKTTQIYTLSVNRSAPSLLYSESFKNSTAQGLVFGGSPNSARLTGGNTDAMGSGYLRLTSNQKENSGFARNTTFLPSAKGYSISFEYFMYGGSGGEGMTFFLYDATANDAFNVGGAAGSLGYAQRSDLSAPGLSKAFLGLGLDQAGNFSNAFQGRQGGPGIRNSSVVLRGDGNGTGVGAPAGSNYEYLTGVQTANATAMISASAGKQFQLAGDQDGRTAPGGSLDSKEDGYRKVRMDMEPNASGTGFKINVYITENTDGTLTTHHLIKDFAYTPTNGIPANLSYGFAANTGATNNFHEIRNLEISAAGTVDAPAITVSDDKPSVKPPLVVTEPEIVLPNATNLISPNGDGINDKWIIRNLEKFPNNVVRIFDRSGRMVYMTKNYTNDWEGTFNGNVLDFGTYYYVADFGHDAKTIKGYISIVR